MLAQTAPAAVPSSSVPSPRLLLKSGLRLTHLFYLPDARSWQLLLPVSFGLEYRLYPRFSAYAQAEADISAGRAPRGRRGAPLLPTPGTSVGMGARYYFNQPSTSQSSSEPWGNYVALEASAELAQLSSRRGRRGRGLSVGRVTPALFALCGTQHRGPGRRLLYDLNAGLGIEAPPAYSAEAGTRPPWDVAAQVNLRVYLANQRHAARTSQD
ncbi:hypothetical protein I7X13_11055 [Hymenobacter sp. BT442]|uniref:DUF3575 domain-containing protein n=2 Tax=Hymenobacter negativus TaxID=2795026 RepID=A0ABS0Q8B2_9BACT|nr:hypothetical protein [Hymenobacter negativus]